MAQQTVAGGGAFTKKNIDDINSNFTELYAGGSGETFVSPTITGTVAGGASYTGPTLTSPTITGTTSIGAGATITSPTLVTPALGTPASGVLTNCTGTAAGLTAGTASAVALGGITGAGTGVLTALAIANGSSGGYAVNAIAGAAAGYKIARSTTPVAVTGTSDVTTGLTTVIAAVACAESDLDGTTLAAVQAVNTGGAGHILLKCWKITAADNGALIAADAAKNVSWIAIGT